MITLNTRHHLTEDLLILSRYFTIFFYLIVFFLMISFQTLKETSMIYIAYRIL